eukprot:7378131-Prymnesium_polylepis.3
MHGGRGTRVSLVQAGGRKADGRHCEGAFACASRPLNRATRATCTSRDHVIASPHVSCPAHIAHAVRMGEQCLTRQRGRRPVEREHPRPAAVVLIERPQQHGTIAETDHKHRRLRRRRAPRHAQRRRSRRVRRLRSAAVGGIELGDQSP